MNNEKNKLNKLYLKYILFTLAFWILLFISYKILLLLTDNGSIIIDYSIIAPIILFSLLYYFTKPVKNIEKVIYILLGFIVPYVFLLLYIYLGIIQGISPKIF